MKNTYARLIIVILISVSLLTATPAHAAISLSSLSSLTSRISSLFDRAVDSIASQFGFSERVSQVSGGYKYNPKHGGMNAQYKSADGSLLTIDYCQNGAHVITILTPCTAAANACGMVGTGFVTKVISHGKQVRSSTSACSAQRIPDSACATTQVTQQDTATSTTDDEETQCVPKNICSSAKNGNVINSCTGALVQDCSVECTDGRCVDTCAPHYFCRNDNLYWGDNSQPSCSTALAQVCLWGCSNNACNPAPSGGNGGEGLTTKGSLVAQPALIQPGNTTMLFWSASYIKPGSCTVVGTNGDTYSGVDAGTAPNTTNSSGTHGVETTAITSRTTYTLTCTSSDGSTFSDTAVVNITPVYQEI